MSPPVEYVSPKVERNGNTTIVTIRDGNIRDVDNALARDLEGLTDGLGACHLLLDFTNVAFLSSVEIGTLIGLHKKLIKSNGRLTLFNLNARMLELFDATRLDTLLDICREETLVS